MFLSEVIAAAELSASGRATSTSAAASGAVPTLPGITPTPRTQAAALKNLNIALGVLRDIERVRSTHLWSAEALSKGDADTAWGLLRDLYKSYHRGTATRQAPPPPPPLPQPQQLQRQQQAPVASSAGRGARADVAVSRAGASARSFVTPPRGSGRTLSSPVTADVPTSLVGTAPATGRSAVARFLSRDATGDDDGSAALARVFQRHFGAGASAAGGGGGVDTKGATRGRRPGTVVHAPSLCDPGAFEKVSEEQVRLSGTASGACCIATLWLALCLPSSHTRPLRPPPSALRPPPSALRPLLPPPLTCGPWLCARPQKQTIRSWLHALGIGKSRLSEALHFLENAFTNGVLFW